MAAHWMSWRWIALIAVLFGLVAALAGAASPARQGQTRWVLTDLGTFGGTMAQPTAINDSGHVVGYSWSERRGAHGFLWEHGRTTDLGEVEFGDPVLINNAGEIVLNGRHGHAYLWNDGARTDLGALGPDNVTRASAIDNKGEIVGWSRTTAGRQHAMLWRQGKLTDLGRWGWRTSRAIAINNKSQVIGWRLLRGTTHTFQSQLRAILWQNGRQTDLGTLAAQGADPTAINDHGVVVGSANTTGWDGRWHAFRWENGRMADLGTLKGNAQSWAVAINDRGQIIATAADDRAPYSDRSHAFMWQKGKTISLQAPKGQMYSWAVAINEQGQVILNTTDGDEETFHAAVWQNDTTTDLGPYSAVAINGHGEIVGTGHDDSVVLWTPRSD
jgi:probable HAF family extracellular repeat protein